MKMNTLPQEFIVAKPILEQLESAGFEAYFVGGSVRDMLLGKAIHDVDIATSAFPEEVKSLFTRTVDTGIQHGTVMVLDHGEGYEITTFRTESTYTDFRRPDEVTFVRSLAEDLKRRDFTINALAMTKDGEIVDLFDGLADMDNQMIRAVGDARVRFGEDALRIMRALRFSSQLGFDIDQDTQQAIISLAPNLKKIAVERIRAEFEKMMMGQQAATSLQLLLTTKVIEYLPVELDTKQLQSVIIDLKHNQASSIKSMWSHMLTRLAINPNEIQQFMRAWKTSRDEMKTVLSIVPVAQNCDQITIDDLYRLVDYQDDFLEVLRVMNIDDDLIQSYLDKFSQLPIKSSRDLALNGSDLVKQGVIAPGPQLGKVLKVLEHAVIHGFVANTAVALMSYAKEWVLNEKN